MGTRQNRRVWSATAARVTRPGRGPLVAIMARGSAAAACIEPGGVVQEVARRYEFSKALWDLEHVEHPVPVPVTDG